VVLEGYVLNHALHFKSISNGVIGDLFYSLNFFAHFSS
jgi:hypothetical protein